MPDGAPDDGPLRRARAAGGSLTFSKEEYEAILARHGGMTMMTVHAEVTQRDGQAPELELTLVRQAPGQGDLVS